MSANMAEQDDLLTGFGDYLKNQATADQDLIAGFGEFQKTGTIPRPKQEPGFFKSIGTSALGSAGSGISGVGTALEDVGLQRLGTPVREYGEGIQQANPSSISQFSDILDKPKQFAGEALGQIGSSIAATGGGALIGRGLGTAIGAALPIPGAAPAIGALGGLAGGFASNLAGEYGETRANQREMGFNDPARALAAAVPAAALDYAADRYVGKIGKLGQLDAIPQGMTRPGFMAQEALKGALIEGPVTEVPQTVLERLGGGKDIASNEALNEYGIAGAMGALGGGVVSGGIGGFAPYAPPTQDQPVITPEQPAEPQQPMGLGSQWETPAFTDYPRQPDVPPTSPVGMTPEEEATVQNPLTVEPATEQSSVTEPQGLGSRWQKPAFTLNPNQPVLGDVLAGASDESTQAPVAPGTDRVGSTGPEAAAVDPVAAGGPDAGNEPRDGLLSSTRQFNTAPGLATDPAPAAPPGRDVAGSPGAEARQPNRNVLDAGQGAVDEAQNTGLVDQAKVEEQPPARGREEVTGTTTDYAQRNQERINRIAQASTQDEMDAVMQDEASDPERHFEGYNSVERAIRDRQFAIEQEAKQQEEQKRYEAGEWARVNTGIMSASYDSATQDAARLQAEDPDNEYTVAGDNMDGWEVRRRKLTQEPTDAAPTPRDLGSDATGLSGGSRPTGAGELGVAGGTEPAGRGDSFSGAGGTDAEPAAAAGLNSVDSVNRPALAPQFTETDKDNRFKLTNVADLGGTEAVRARLKEAGVKVPGNALDDNTLQFHSSQRDKIFKALEPTNDEQNQLPGQPEQPAGQEESTQAQAQEEVGQSDLITQAAAIAARPPSERITDEERDTLQRGTQTNYQLALQDLEGGKSYREAGITFEKDGDLTKAKRNGLPIASFGNGRDARNRNKLIETIRGNLSDAPNQPAPVAPQATQPDNQGTGDALLPTQAEASQAPGTAQGEQPDTQGADTRAEPVALDENTLTWQGKLRTDIAQSNSASNVTGNVSSTGDTSQDADTQFRAGKLSINEYLQNQGIDPDEYQRDTRAVSKDAKGRVPYFQLMSEMKTEAGKLKRAKAILPEIEAIESNLENPFATNMAAARSLPPILKRKFQQRFAELPDAGATSFSDSVRRSLRDAQTQAETEQVIGFAKNRNVTGNVSSTLAPWQQSFDDFANQQVEQSKYAETYRNQPKLAEDFKKQQSDKWIDALKQRATEGRVDDKALDDFVGRYGVQALQNTFRGQYEKGIEGYMPPDIRAETVTDRPIAPQDKPAHEMTWAEYRKYRTLDGRPDNAPRTPAYWQALKKQHRTEIARKADQAPESVRADYPDMFPPNAPTSPVTGEAPTLNIAQRGQFNGANSVRKAMGKPALTEAEWLAEQQGTEPPASRQEASTAATRTKPKNTIQFSNAITGPSGAKMDSYTWQWREEDQADRNGEMRPRRVSDWEKAGTSDDTGRDIVHQFTVTKPDGSQQMMSAESAIKALGFAGADARGVKEAVTTSKTLARLQMASEQATQSLQTLNQDLREIKAVQPAPIKTINPSTRHTVYQVGDVEGKTPGDAKRLWRVQQLKKRGWDVGDSAYYFQDELAKKAERIQDRLAKAQTRLDGILSRQAQPPAETGQAAATPEQAQEPWQMTRDDFVQARYGSRIETIDKLAKLKAERNDLENRLSSNQRGVSASTAKKYRLWVANLTDEIKRLEGLVLPADKTRSASWLKYQANEHHKQEIREAIESGLPVPKDVLKDYPDLNPGTKPKQNLGQKLKANAEREAEQKEQREYNYKRLHGFVMMFDHAGNLPKADAKRIYRKLESYAKGNVTLDEAMSLVEQKLGRTPGRMWVNERPKNARSPNAEPPAQEPTPDTQTPNVSDTLRNDPDAMERVASLVAQAGWAQKGGYLYRLADGTPQRTDWLPKSDWWLERPDGTTEKDFKETLTRLQSGRKLSPKQERVADFLNDLQAMTLPAEVVIDTGHEQLDEKLAATVDELVENALRDFGEDVVNAVVAKASARAEGRSVNTYYLGIKYGLREIYAAGGPGPSQTNTGTEPRGSGEGDNGGRPNSQEPRRPTTQTEAFGELSAEDKPTADRLAIQDRERELARRRDASQAPRGGGLFDIDNRQDDIFSEPAEPAAEAAPTEPKPKKRRVSQKARTEQEQAEQTQAEQDDDNDIPMFSRADEQPRDLVFTHNLSADNLLHADKMGGIPVPSLAVTKRDTPLSGFGEITLIGTPEMADPKGYAKTKVYGADIYSPRYPGITYEVKAPAVRATEKKLDAAIQATANRIQWDSVESDGSLGLENSAPVMWQFLKDQGLQPNVPMVAEKELSPELRPFAENTRYDYELAADPAFQKAALDAYAAMYRKIFRDAGDSMQDVRRKTQERIGGMRDGSDPDAVRRLAQSSAMELRAYQRSVRESGKVDAEAVPRALQKQIAEANLGRAYADYAKEMLAGIPHKERIFQGYTNSGNRRYIDHTLENVVKILKQNLRGGESFNYGLGSVRAKFTPEMKSINQIRENKNRLVDKATFEKVKKDLDDEFASLRDRLGAHHSYSNNLGFMDVVAETLADAATMGLPRALTANQFKDVPSDLQAEVAGFLNTLRNLPTEYFEAKILRDVSLSEFTGAVVPDNVDPRVLKVLKDAGITDIQQYKQGDEQDRTRAIQAFERAMFSREQNPIFYSQLARAFDSAKSNTMPGNQWASWIKGNAAKLGVKADEIAWTGIDDYLTLRAKEKVSKQEIAEYLNQNGVQVEEVMKGDFNTAEIDWVYDGDNGWDYRDYTIGKIADGKYLLINPAKNKYRFGSLEEAKSAAEDQIRKYGEAGAPTKFSTYTIPGGTNYRELLITLPSSTLADKALADRLTVFGTEDRGVIKYGIAEGDDYNKHPVTYATRAEAERERKRLIESSASSYKSGHWDDPNVLAHLRFDERTDADGNRVMFIQELQSDWGQEGKKKGFKTPYAGTTPNVSARVMTGREFVARQSMPDAAAKSWLDSRNAIRADIGQPMVSFDDTFTVIFENDIPKIVKDGALDAEREAAKYRSRYDAMVRDARAKHEQNQASRLPNAPFVTDTKAWVSLALKRAIRYAAENGFDKIAFANGQQNADLYDLSKQVEYINYRKVGDDKYQLEIVSTNGTEVTLPKDAYAAEELEDVVGKEIAQKIVNDEGERNGQRRTLRDMDLKVGGEGMRAFYDQIVPSVANDVLKKLGGPRVGAVTVNTGISAADWDDANSRMRRQLAKDGAVTEQPGFTLTPELREKALGGLPLFSFAGQQAATADTMALSTAQQRLDAGENAETVRRETGWFKGKDGKWRFEINDADARAVYPGTFANAFKEARKLNLQLWGGSPDLSDVLRHPALFAAYPSLARMDVQLMPEGVKAKGRLAQASVNGESLTPTLEIRGDLSSDEWVNVALHEIQHGIQTIEGFATGGSSIDAFADPRMRPGSTKAGLAAANKLLKERLLAMSTPMPIEQYAKQAWQQHDITPEIQSDYAEYVRDVKRASASPNMQQAAQSWAGKEWYRRLAGEVEARNVQARQRLTDAERRATPPNQTADVSDDDVIVTFNGLVMENAPMPQNLAATGRPVQQEVGAVLSRDAVQARIDVIRPKLRISPKVTIKAVDTESELPADIQAQARKEGAVGQVIAVHQGNSIYLVAGKHDSAAKVEESIYHEATHYGANVLFGRAKHAIYNRLFNQLGGEQGIREYANRLGLKMEPYFATARGARGNLPDMRVNSYLVDEFLANAQGTKAYATLPQKIKTAIQEFYGAIRNWLRQQGFAELAKFTDADLAYLLRSIHKAAQGEVASGRGKPMFMVAWHGSPHDHDKFSTSKIGTGEGAQAFGWGLYFSNAKEIAEYYREALAAKRGVGLVDADGNAFAPTGTGMDSLVAVFLATSQGDYAKTRKDLKDTYDGALLEDVLRQLDKFERDGIKANPADKGKLYQVELAPAEDEYLDWHKPLSEQSEKVKAALRKGNIESDYDKALADFAKDQGMPLDDAKLLADFTMVFDAQRLAEAIYYRLTKEQGSKKAASEYLHSLGIRGIRYPAEGQTGGKSGDRFNYVIFDENDIEITAKFSRAGQTIDVDGVQRPTTNSEGRPIHPTEAGIRNFWRWFGSSQVTDEQGRPLPVYHGTAKDFSAFSDSAQGDNFLDYDGAFPRDGFWFTSDPDNAYWYSNVSARGLEGEREGGGQRIVPAYLSLQKPYRYTLEMFVEEGESGIPSQLELEQQGYDGMIVEIADEEYSIPPAAEAMWEKYTPQYGAPMGWPAELREKYDELLDVPPQLRHTHYVSFSPNQIKSSIGNTGAFSPDNNDIRFSRQYTPEQQAVIDKFAAGQTMQQKPWRERVQDVTDNWQTAWAQKMVDRYRSFRDILRNPELWMQARLAGQSEGAVHAGIHFGAPEWDAMGQAIQTNLNTKPLEQINQDLGGEINDFLKWRAAQRADLINRKADTAAQMAEILGNDIAKLESQIEALSQAKGNQAERIADLQKQISETRREMNAARKAARIRERFLDDETIAAALTFNEGTMADGRDRAAVYAQAMKDFNKLNDAYVNLNVEAGAISEEDAERWRSEGVYVPFYRFLQDDEGNTSSRGLRDLASLDKQTAFRQYKGSAIPLNDLLSNVLANWHHLAHTATHNATAVKALEQASDMGLAERIPEAQADDKSLWVREDGKKVFYRLANDSKDAKLVWESIQGMNYQGWKNGAMDAAQAMAGLLRAGVTANPVYRYRNLIRDTMQALATSNVPLNAVVKGWQQTGPKTIEEIQRYANMLASGGLFGIHEAGYLREGNPGAANAKAMLKLGAKPDTDNAILLTQVTLSKIWDKYQDMGARLENVNRAAAFTKTYDETGSLLKAAFEANDLMPFQMRGTSQILFNMARVVPFFNSRLQGLDKLARSATDPETRQRFWAVTGTYVALSLMAYLALKDDDDYEELEQWKRDAYHYFKVDGQLYKIPRPFEMGVLAMLVERTAEQVFKDVPASLWVDRVMSALGDTFAMNPIPQALKPMVDVYANRDSFTGRPIESLGMENRSKTQRKTPDSSYVGVGVSEALDALFKTMTLGKQETPLSPVQVDELVKGYLGWVGSFALAGSTMILDGLTGAPDKPEDIRRIPIVGDMLNAISESDTPRSTAYSSAFYDHLKIVRQAQADFNQSRKLGDTKQMQDIRTDKPAAFAAKDAYNKAASSLTDINNMMQKIQAGNDPGDVKKRKLDELTRRKNRITQTIESRFGKTLETF